MFLDTFEVATYQCRGPYPSPMTAGDHGPSIDNHGFTDTRTTVTEGRHNHERNMWSSRAPSLIFRRKRPGMVPLIDRGKRAAVTRPGHNARGDKTCLGFFNVQLHTRDKSRTCGVQMPSHTLMQSPIAIFLLCFFLLLESVGPCHQAIIRLGDIQSDNISLTFSSAKTHDAKRRIIAIGSMGPHSTLLRSIPPHITFKISPPNDTTRHDQRDTRRGIVNSTFFLFFYARFPEYDRPRRRLEETGINSKQATHGSVYFCHFF